MEVLQMSVVIGMPFCVPLLFIVFFSGYVYHSGNTELINDKFYKLFDT